jgi:hypothetical protein
MYVATDLVKVDLAIEQIKNQFTKVSEVKLSCFGQEKTSHKKLTEQIYENLKD